MTMNDRVRDRDGGALFSNNRKQNPNQPDYRGEIAVSREVVEDLMKQLQKGVQFPMMELAGWKKTSNNGTVYVSLSGKKPYEKNGGNGGSASGGGGQRNSSWPSAGQQGGAGFGGVFGGGNSNLDDEIPF